MFLISLSIAVGGVNLSQVELQDLLTRQKVHVSSNIARENHLLISLNSQFFFLRVIVLICLQLTCDQKETIEVQTDGEWVWFGHMTVT